MIALGLFVWRQLALQRSDEALLDLRVFQTRTFTVPILHLLFMNAAFFGSLTILPLYLQSVVGATSIQTGLTLLPGELLSINSCTRRLSDIRVLH